MNPSSSNASWARLAGVMLIVSAVFISGVLIFMQFRRLRVVEEQRKLADKQAALLDRLASELQARPALRKIAVAPASPNEQPLFLNTLRGYADASRVQIVRYENKPAPASQPNSPEAKTNTLPAGVTALTGSVEVSGEYNAIRQFLYQLLRSDRLYNTTDLKWSNGNQGGNGDKWPKTHLAFTLLRYVEAPAVAPPAAPAGSRGTASS